MEKSVVKPAKVKLILHYETFTGIEFEKEASHQNFLCIANKIRYRLDEWKTGI